LKQPVKLLSLGNTSNGSQRGGAGSPRPCVDAAPEAQNCPAYVSQRTVSLWRMRYKYPVERRLDHRLYPAGKPLG